MGLANVSSVFLLMLHSTYVRTFKYKMSSGVWDGVVWVRRMKWTGGTD